MVTYNKLSGEVHRRGINMYKVVISCPDNDTCQLVLLDIKKRLNLADVKVDEKTITVTSNDETVMRTMDYLTEKYSIMYSSSQAATATVISEGLDALFGDDISEAIAFKWKEGDTARYEKWLSAYLRKYQRIMGKKLRDVYFKAGGKNYYAMVFENGALGVLQHSGGDSEITHFALEEFVKGPAGRWKLTADNKLVSSKGQVLDPIPNDIKSTKALMEWAELEDQKQKDAAAGPESTSTTSDTIMRSIGLSDNEKSNLFTKAVEFLNADARVSPDKVVMKDDGAVITISDEGEYLLSTGSGSLLYKGKDLNLLEDAWMESDEGDEDEDDDWGRVVQARRDDITNSVQDAGYSVTSNIYGGLDVTNNDDVRVATLELGNGEVLVTEPVSGKQEVVTLDSETIGKSTLSTITKVIDRIAPKTSAVPVMDTRDSDMRMDLRQSANDYPNADYSMDTETLEHPRYTIRVENGMYVMDDPEGSEIERSDDLIDIQDEMDLHEIPSGPGAGSGSNSSAAILQGLAGVEDTLPAASDPSPESGPLVTVSAAKSWASLKERDFNHHTFTGDVVSSTPVEGKEGHFSEIKISGMTASEVETWLEVGTSDLPSWFNVEGGGEDDSVRAIVKNSFTPTPSSSKTAEIQDNGDGTVEVTEFLHGEPGSPELKSYGATGGQRAVMTSRRTISKDSLSTFLEFGEYARVSSR
ncbi:hypothetical protein NVP1031O_160 [Vibrio phage 1.031.O._10N.261.46.F8]|nr:hypothetical protein NVP1031O_160 [Vibrio phage 1.031.O._10N.261.46.F8]